MADDSTPIPFGKYKGLPLGDVPARYLDWLLTQDWLQNYPEVKSYIIENIRFIHQEIEDEEDI